MLNETIEIPSGLPGDFLRWWRNEPGSSRQFFHTSLNFDGVFLETEGQLWLNEQAPPFESLRILECFSSENKAALVVEGVDPVTNSSQRIAWLFDIRDGKIAQVIETRMNIPPREEAVR